ncbi:lipocalin family protein [Granulicella sp. WH15]|nr:lipocalin family protein [Granulicella sp. WH15]
MRSRMTMICLLLAGAQALRGQSVRAVPKVDLPSFTGTWYEVARYADKREKECVGDVFMLIALADKPNRFQLVNSCKTKTGYTDTNNGNGRTQDKSGDGKLKVTYIWPFSKKFWVLAVGPGYEWSLVGNPNHKDLRVLARTTTMKPEVLAEIKAKAAAQGFPVGKLVMTPQTPRQVARRESRQP